MAKLKNLQSNLVVYIILAISILFSLFLYLKVVNLEKKLTTLQPTQAQQQPTPLSVDNLKKYAKDLGLDSKKFNQCLDSGSKQNLVMADENYGTSLGVAGTPGFFINGKLLAGAFPYEFFKEIIDKEIAGAGSTSCSDYSQTLQQYCSNPNNKSFDPVPKKIDLGNAPSVGASNPKVILVEFSDFQCPYCLRAEPTVRKILQDYKNEVRFYNKQFPLNSIHPYAEKAAEASLCALDQGQDKFWKYHNKLFDAQS